MTRRKRVRWAGAVFGAAIALALAQGAAASATVRTYTLRYGPQTLAAYQVKQDTTPVRAPRVDGYIVGMTARVVDRHGHAIPISRIMLHHVLFKDLGSRSHPRRDGTCPSLPRERIYGTGEEHQVLRLPPGYGIPIRRSDRWQASWMLMNHRPISHAAWIEYRVTVETGPRLTPVKAYWLDVTGCRGNVYYSTPGGGPPGSVSARSTTWRVPFDGRLVAGGAHLHGGALDVRATQPRCGRQLPTSNPLYGMPDNIVYHVLPVLHEPGPINTSWFMTRTGIPVVKGERIVVTSRYDGEYPHTMVMGIDHLYMARARHVPRGCAPPPPDLTNTNIPVPGRTTPPHVVVPLTGYGPNGVAQTIDRPPGPTLSFNGGTSVNVRGFRFGPRNISIPLGASVTWHFIDSVLHDVALANGPLGFSSSYSHSGARFTQRFTRPGTYQLFCTLHPVLMQATVEVRGGAGGHARAARAAPAPPAGVQSGPTHVIHW